MKLKQLEIHGFKSFPNKTKIEFHDGVTAIVGPNGSGKSNVADAVRWVLGEQSIKNLRGGKMEDVIFNGSQDRKPLGFAEVSLTIDNSEGAIKSDYSEITVTRRIFRSGESEYYINKSGCRLKDITELFMDTGVGKEGYSIIGQGRIEQILSSKPDERRKIFDEAAGITKYKARRKEAERKLERTVDNIDRVDDIIGEISSRLEPLSKQSKNAKKYLEIKEQLKQYELNQFIRQYDKMREENEKMASDTVLINEDIKRQQELVEESEQRLDKLLDQSKGLAQRIEEETKKRFGLTTEIEKISGQISLLQQKCEHHQQECQRIENTKDTADSIVEERNREIQELFKQKEELQSTIENQNENIQKLEKALQSLRTQEDEHRNELEQKRIAIIESLQKVNNERERLREHQTAVENAKIRKEVQEKQALDCENNIENIERLLEEIKKTSQESEIALGQKEAQKQEARRTMSTGQASLDKLISEGQALKSKLNKLQSRYDIISEMVENFEGYYKSVKEIMKQTQNQHPRMAGVRGTVASLLQCDAKYETAIEMALASAMQDIVIETEEDADGLIQFLKKNKLGRATFLPMHAVEMREFSVSEEREITRMIGCVGVAYDLIEYDAQYHQVFKHLLGKIVIAEDMHAAIEIARKYRRRFKIVTLTGEVINSGGAITGGSQGKHVTKIIGRERELAEIESDIKAIQHKYSKAKEERELLVKKYDDAKKQVEQLNREIQEINITKASETANISSLESAIGEETLKYQKLIENQESIDDEITMYEEQLDKQRAIIKNIENSDEEDASTEEYERLLREMLQERERQQIAINQVKNEIRDKQQEIALIDQAIVGKRRDIDDTLRTKQDGERELEVLNEAITNLYEQIESYEKEREQLKDKEQLLSNTNESVDQKLDDYNEQIRQTNQVIKDNTATLESMRNQLHKIEVTVSKNEVKMENLTENIKESYDISYAGALTYLDYEIPESELNEKTAEFKKAIQRLGNVNVNAIEEYREVKERYEFLTTQRNDLLSAKENLNSVINDITGTMQEQFKREFSAISISFTRVFSELFGGGKAQLILTDEDDPLECGIDIIAQPPGKRLQNMMLLSGGEKALTAIAILFAILEHRPTPFCILDEIEAALDDQNVDNFGSYLNKFSNKTQFVIITHRKGTMEAADSMYGVAMQEKGVSQLVSVKLEETA